MLMMMMLMLMMMMIMVVVVDLWKAGTALLFIILSVKTDNCPFSVLLSFDVSSINF